MRSTLGIGRFTASQRDGVMAPFDYVTGLPPVLACHGLSADATQALGFQPAQAVIYKRVTDYGLTIVAPSTTSGWGNATSRTRAAEAITYARASLGCSTAPVVRCGVSHGATVALQSAYANLADTACIVLILPAVDLEYARVQDTVEGIAGLRASIDLAAGVTYPAALPANFSPLDIAAGLASIPILAFTCSDDDVSHNFATFAANHGNTTIVDLGALGHTEAAVAAADPETMVAFIQAHT